MKFVGKKGVNFTLSQNDKFEFVSSSMESLMHGERPQYLPATYHILKLQNVFHLICEANLNSLLYHGSKRIFINGTVY